MASVAFINQLNSMFVAALVSGKDIRGRLCMTNCDAATKGLTSAANLAAVTTDVSDATGYADVAITTEAAVLDDPNDRGEFYDSGAVSMIFTGLGGDASRNYLGVILYEYIDGTDANDIPWFWHELTPNVPKEATQVTVTWNAEGIAWIRNAA